MNPRPNNPNKFKHRARRKANEKRIQTSRSNSEKSIAKWLKEWAESRSDYPVTNSKKKRKPLTKEALRKWFKSK